MIKEENASVFTDRDDQIHLAAPEQNECVCDLSDDEKIDIVAQRVLQKYLPAFKELAK